MDNEQLERARQFAANELAQRVILDEWIDFESLDLHFYFDEVGEYKVDNGVFAYPVTVDDEGFRSTDTSHGAKILDWTLAPISKHF